VARTVGQTRTLGGDGGPGLPREDALVLIGQADQPLAGSARHALGGVDEVLLGRGSERRADRGGAQLRVRVADEWMSSRHAALRRQRAHWVVEDLGSKNGTLVNGERQQRAILVDGDLLELGRTFWLFRADQPAAPDGDGAGAPEGLATLEPALAADFAELIRIAPSTAPVLIEGPTGAGKELVARAVHALSRRPGELVAVNCAALPANLVESELFGYRKGAFSGATEDRAGLIAAAGGGTLFLDEIGDLPPPAQGALLRVLEERRVRPIGATAAAPVDLRVVAATHRDLADQVAAGGFREDLFSRLAGFAVELPPLRARRADLGLLIAALLGRLAGRRAGQVAFTGEALRALLRHDWPRNVRELARCLERALALAGGAPIALAHLPPELREPPAPAPPERALSDDDAARRDRLIGLLEQHRGNVSEVARSLGKVRAQVQRWLKRYRIDAERYR
jgi:DNA-binding NtrC family response regulator